MVVDSDFHSIVAIHRCGCLLQMGSGGHLCDSVLIQSNINRMSMSEVTPWVFLFFVIFGVSSTCSLFSKFNRKTKELFWIE